MISICIRSRRRSVKSPTMKMMISSNSRHRCPNTVVDRFESLVPSLVSCRSRFTAHLQSWCPSSRNRSRAMRPPSSSSFLSSVYLQSRRSFAPDSRSTVTRNILLQRTIRYSPSTHFTNNLQTTASAKRRNNRQTCALVSHPGLYFFVNTYT